MSHSEKNLTDVASPNSSFKDDFLRLCVSIYAMKMLAKERSCLCTHRSAVDL